MELQVVGLSRDTRHPEQMARWQKMEAVRQTCEELEVDVPQEVIDYLQQYPAPREFDLSAALNTYNVYRQDTQEQRIEINLKDVPETVETIRIIL